MPALNWRDGRVNSEIGHRSVLASIALHSSSHMPMVSDPVSFYSMHMPPVGLPYLLRSGPWPIIDLEMLEMASLVPDSVLGQK